MTASRLSKPDTRADHEVAECIAADPPQSFVVEAGAGSGKTTTLVKAIAQVRAAHGPSLESRRQQLACITYTEAAAEEIARELGKDPLVFVSTIHGFFWDVVRPFQEDLAEWVRAQLTAKGGSSNEVQFDKVTYGLTPKHIEGRIGAANIQPIACGFLAEHRLLRDVIRARFPFIFVDESQDTRADVVEALLSLRVDDAAARVCLGFFGDPMQQIYLDGVGRIDKVDRRISKPENYRSSLAVLDVINAVRGEDRQVPGRDSTPPGAAAFFVLPSGGDRAELMAQAMDWVKARSGEPEVDPRVLVIVHEMTAKYGGYGNLYAAFKASRLKEELQEGRAAALRPIQGVLHELAQLADPDHPEMLARLRQAPALAGSSADVLKVLARLRASVEQLQMIWNEPTTTISDLLSHAFASGLVELDEPWMTALDDPSSSAVDSQAAQLALRRALLTVPLAEVKAYVSTLQRNPVFSTQQGSKGTEYPGVVVVLDQEENTHRQFDFDKLLGLADLSGPDRQRISSGESNVIDRSQRLLYVAVSRAQQALAVVWLTPEVETARGLVSARYGDTRAVVLGAEDL